MAVYNEKTEDNFSRQITPVLCNTAKDGSGTWYFALVNSSGQLEVSVVAGTAAIGLAGHDITGLADGVKTVSTAGTGESLAASTAAKAVIIQAQTDNTGWIAVGNAGVDATEATGTGVLLAAGDSVTLLIDNLADVYIDATIATDGVRYTYLT